MEAMGAAADAGDLDAMRLIWKDKLSGMFTSQTDIDSTSHALGTGDPNVLRQMFS
jgi:hypothetical protein